MSGFWKMSGRYQKGLRTVSGRCLEGVQKLCGMCLEGTPENIFDQRPSQDRSIKDRSSHSF